MKKHADNLPAVFSAVSAYLSDSFPESHLITATAVSRPAPADLEQVFHYLLLQYKTTYLCPGRTRRCKDTVPTE